VAVAPLFFEGLGNTKTTKDTKKSTAMNLTISAQIEKLRIASWPSAVLRGLRVPRFDFAFATRAQH
jgi:hypothetical protein